MRVVHYLQRWLDPTMGFVHDYVTGSRFPGLVVSRQAVADDPGGVRVVSLRALEGRPHAFRSVALSALTRAQRAGALHVHFGYVAPDVVGVVRRRRLPLVVSVHGHDVTALGREHYAGVTALDPLVVAPSRWLADRAGRLGFRRVQVVPSGVDTGFFTPPGEEPDEPRVCFVGRLVEKKGIDVLMAAWPAVRAEVPGARLDVLGAGPLAATVGGDGVSLLRPAPRAAARAQVRDLLRRAAVVATPSRTAADGDAESLLLVNLEAAACGRPVVSTWHGGIPEYVADGETGLLVPERDPVALAGAIVTLLRDRSLASTLGAEARSRVEALDVRLCTSRRDDAVEAATR